MTLLDLLVAAALSMGESRPTLDSTSFVLFHLNLTFESQGFVELQMDTV